MSGGMRQYVGMAVAGTLLLAAGFGLYWVLGMGRGATGDGAGADRRRHAGQGQRRAAAADHATEPRFAGARPARRRRRRRRPRDAGLDATRPPDADVTDVAAVGRRPRPAKGLANRKVRTVTVRPDGTIVSGDDAVAGAEALPVERPNVPDVPGADVEPSDLLDAVTADAANALAADPIAAPIRSLRRSGADGARQSMRRRVDPATRRTGCRLPPARRRRRRHRRADAAAASARPRQHERPALALGDRRGRSPRRRRHGRPPTAGDRPARQRAAARRSRAAAATAAAYVQLSSQRERGRRPGVAANVSVAVRQPVQRQPARGPARRSRRQGHLVPRRCCRPARCSEANHDLRADQGRRRRLLRS